MLARWVFRCFGYLLNSPILCTKESSNFNRFYRKYEISNVSETKLLASVKFLPQLLNKHLNKVMVLSENVDEPIEAALVYSWKPIVEEIISFVRKFISNISGSYQCVGKGFDKAGECNCTQVCYTTIRI